MNEIINFNEIEFEKMQAHQTNSFYWNLKKIIINDLWMQYYNKSLKVLDYGCGTGFLFKDIVNANTDILFVDGLAIAEKTIKNNFPNAKFKHGIIDDIQEKFDIIFLLDVLEHIENEKNFIDKISHLLSINGKLIITVPAHMWLFSDADLKSGHCRRYSVKNLNNVIMNNKTLKLEKNYSFIILMLPILVLSRLMAKIKTYKIEKENNEIINRILIKLIPLEYLLSKYMKIKFGASIVSVYTKNG